MAAYAAAVSLKNTIQCILQSSRISLVPPSPQILHPAYKAMCRLQKVLLKLDETGYSKIRTKVNALDEQIKEAIWEFEDLLESHFYDQILQQLERDHSSFSLDLQTLRERVDNFIERVTVMKTEYDTELLSMPEEESEPISSRIDFCGINSKRFGSCNCYKFTKDNILAEGQGICFSVIGMAGVGKTTLAKKVFDDPAIQRHFELRAWVKVGRKCESNETLRCILAQLDPSTRDQMLNQGEDGDDDFEKLFGVLEERLKDKKCLIVMDDVWEWDRQLMDRFPKENVRVLLTSRLRMKEFPFLRMCLLDEKESKKLLGEKLFGEHGFPPHLEKLGEKIVKKCEGIPLLIVTVAELLSKEDITPQYWTEVVEKQHNSVFVDAYDQISEVLFPSYEYLHQHLKMFFLYLGAYPPYSDIHKSEFEHQMIAEGFLEPIREHTIQKYIQNCLAMLHDRYNLIIHKGNVNSWFSQHKLCVPSCWQHVCKKEASKTKFLHVLQSCDEVMKDQRRLCAHWNT
ncbi:putative disease resistance protein At1g50180 [Salvia splendens]|uniref:putative disease resistance protein At1g50180 n=1 Tax=Salvia splendens TaxID=180675 RepID=UPI001C2743D1|nr:putative disease resistance protein At1g50180 [Salvia splendens]XP_042012939.1 putative disease resistance protein At1g50180 [Salvia splendens]